MPASDCPKAIRATEPMTGRAGRVIAIIAVLGQLLASCEAAPAGTPVGCPLLTIDGTLEALRPPGSSGIQSGERHLVITWGNGFHASTVGGRLVVLGPDGAVVGHEGDSVELTGR